MDIDFYGRTIMRITHLTTLTPRLIKFFCASIIIVILAALSQPSFSATPKNDCAFWKSQFADYNGARINIYKGECKNGQAHGKGAVYSYERIKAGEPARDIYRGSFRRGVFFKGTPYEGKLLFDGRAIATLLGKVRDSEVWLHTEIGQDEGVSICKTNLINIATDNFKPYAGDDEKAKALILEALTLYIEHCPKTDLDIKTAIVERKYEIYPNAQEPIVNEKVNLKKQ